jgi:hypothetical protein
MSKKDYERAAEIVQGWEETGQLEATTAFEQCLVSVGTKAMTEAFLKFFSADSPRFDAARFRAACMPGANVRARPKKERSE